MEHIRLSLSQFFFYVLSLRDVEDQQPQVIIIFHSRKPTLWGSTSNYSVPDLGVPLGIFDYIWGLDVWAINLADTSRYKICIYIYIYTYKHQKSPSTGIFSRFQMAETGKSWSIKRPHQWLAAIRPKTQPMRSTALLYINEMEHMPQSHLFGRPSLFRARIGCWGNNPFGKVITIGVPEFGRKKVRWKPMETSILGWFFPGFL